MWSYEGEWRAGGGGCASDIVEKRIVSPNASILSIGARTGRYYSRKHKLTEIMDFNLLKYINFGYEILNSYYINTMIYVSRMHIVCIPSSLMYI